MRYTWRCRICREVLEIVRPLEKYDHPPDSNTCPICGKVTEWEKVYTPNAHLGEKGKGRWTKV